MNNKSNQLGLITTHEHAIFVSFCLDIQKDLDKMNDLTCYESVYAESDKNYKRVWFFKLSNHNKTKISFTIL